MRGCLFYRWSWICSFWLFLMSGFLELFAPLLLAKIFTPCCETPAVQFVEIPVAGPVRYDLALPR